MAEIVTLLLMMAVPLCLYLAVQRRAKKDPGWKKFAAFAIGVFVALIVVAKM